ncbi:unnamed protein product, partial [Cylicostephanus goldi]
MTSAYTTNDDYKFKDKKNEEKEDDILEKSNYYDYTTYLDTKREKSLKSDDSAEKSKESEGEERLDYGTHELKRTTIFVGAHDDLEETTDVVKSHVTTAKENETVDENVVEDA